MLMKKPITEDFRKPSITKFHCEVRATSYLAAACYEETMYLTMPNTIELRFPMSKRSKASFFVQMPPLAKSSVPMVKMRAATLTADIETKTW